MQTSEFRVAKAFPLTQREAEALMWTAQGKTAWEAGSIMGVTEGTAKAHLRNAMFKLRATNKPHAVARAFVLGILGGRVAAFILALSCLFGSGTADAMRATRRPNQQRPAHVREWRLKSGGRTLPAGGKRGFQLCLIGGALLQFDQRRPGLLENVS